MPHICYVCPLSNATGTDIPCCDDQTNDSLCGKREEIKQFITKLIVIPFDKDVKKSDDHAY